MDYINILEKIKPFIAILVLFFIVLSCTQLIKYNKFQKEIKENCGYENNEKVFCVCDKNLVSQIPMVGNPYYDNSDLDISNLIGINNNSGGE